MLEGVGEELGCCSPLGVAMLPPSGVISITICQSCAKKYSNLDILSHSSSYEGLSFTPCSKQSGWCDGMTARKQLAELYDGVADGSCYQLCRSLAWTKFPGLWCCILLHD